MGQGRGFNLSGIVAGVMCLATVASAEQRPASKPPSLYDSRVGTPSLARVLTRDANTRPVELRLTSRFAMSPATMRSLVRVAPHEDNRKLRVEVDSAAYFRASEIDLDGKNAPPNHYFAWSELPAGTYSIVVTVLGANGRRESSELPFQVLGSGSTISDDSLPDGPPRRGPRQP
jgi:hypothetical protein